MYQSATLSTSEHYSISAARSQTNHWKLSLEVYTSLLHTVDLKRRRVNMYAIAERTEMVDALKHWLVRPRIEQVIFDVECGYQANQQPLTPKSQENVGNALCYYTDHPTKIPERDTIANCVTGSIVKRYKLQRYTEHTFRFSRRRHNQAIPNHHQLMSPYLQHQAPIQRVRIEMRQPRGRQVYDTH